MSNAPRDPTAARGIVLLGSTGSIGRQAVDVLAGDTAFRVVGLAAGGNVELLAEQARALRPSAVVIADDRSVAGLRGDVPEGVAGRCRRRGAPGARDAPRRRSRRGRDGRRGQPPAGPRRARRRARSWRPPTRRPSSPAAISSCRSRGRGRTSAGPWQGRRTRSRARSAGCARSTRSTRRSGRASPARTSPRWLVSMLTGSGGPFLDLPAEAFAAITPEQALKHPTWSMGAKITINSATLANKGLEVIEARWLYDVGYEQIDVVIHPQSVVHSAVQFVDGSLKAQLGTPDMRLPIQYALTYPDRRPSPAAAAGSRGDRPPRVPRAGRGSLPGIANRPRRRPDRPARHGRAHRRGRRGRRALPRRLARLPGHPAAPRGCGGEIRRGAGERRPRCRAS